MKQLLFLIFLSFCVGKSYAQNITLIKLTDENLIKEIKEVQRKNRKLLNGAGVAKISRQK